MTQINDLEFVNEKEMDNVVSLEKKIEAALSSKDQKLTLTIKTDVLKKAVSALSGSLASKTTIPILTYLYIHSSPEQVTLRAANGQFYSETRIKNTEDFIHEGQNGGLALPGKSFIELVSKMSGKNITLEFDDLQVTVKSRGAKPTLKGFDLMEYPAFPVYDETSAITLPSDTMDYMYKKTMYAVSKSETRPILTGILHEIVDGKLRLIATDSHRLSRVNHTLTSFASNASRTIPYESIKEVSKLLKSVDRVSISFDENLVQFVLGNTTIISRTIEGTYPDTDRIVPSASKTEATFTVGELRDVLNRSILYVNDKGISLITMLLDAGKRQLRVQSPQTDFGEFQEDLRPMESQGESLALSCNARYMIDALSVHGKEEKVTIEFTGPTSPFVLRINSGHEDNLDLALPVRNPSLIETVDLTDFSAPEGELDPFTDRIKRYEAAS